MSESNERDYRTDERMLSDSLADRLDYLADTMDGVTDVVPGMPRQGTIREAAKRLRELEPAEPPVVLETGEKLKQAEPLVKETETTGLAGETVFLCAKCGYGGPEHAIEGHPAYLCIADMREVPARFERAADAPKEGWVSVTLRPWEESSFGEQIVTLNDPESPNLAPGVYQMRLVPTPPAPLEEGEDNG